MKFIPSARLVPLLLPWIEQHSLKDLAEFSGISDRHIARILNGVFIDCRFETADALLCAIDQPEAWYVELADLYLRGAARPRQYSGQKPPRAGPAPSLSTEGGGQRER
jgi:hypothetical protein